MNVIEERTLLALGYLDDSCDVSTVGLGHLGTGEVAVGQCERSRLSSTQGGALKRLVTALLVLKEQDQAVTRCVCNPVRIFSRLGKDLAVVVVHRDELNALGLQPVRDVLTS